MNALVCPLCHLPLIENTVGLICENHHQFDRSRHGYFNLLPAQHKNSKQPGESKEQLSARRIFLSAGYFLPLAESLLTCIPKNINILVDLGCGEGYFSRRLAQHLSAATSYAVDISKSAIQMVAKNSTVNMIPIVASNFQLPFAKDSVDVVTRILAPSVDSEVFQILRSGGLFVVVRPQGDHLKRLRERIYTELKPYQSAKVPTGFSLEREFSVKFELNIQKSEDARCLLQMTPFAWRFKQDDLDIICEKGWQDTAEFNLAVYRKCEEWS